MKNVVQVVVGSRDVIRAPALWRYDREQYIEISGLDLPASYMAEMSNAPTGDAEQYLQTSATIHVPSKFLTSTDPVYIWLTFVDEEGRTTRREIICPVTNRGEPVDAVPTPEEQTAIDQAIAALNIAVDKADEAVEHYPVITDGVWYVWDVDAAVYVSTGVSAIGPKGDKGDPGERGETGSQGPRGETGATGAAGADGFSPVATVTQTASGATISITDKTGTTTADIANGQDGVPGQPGQDGVSPSITITDITGGHRVTITDATGAHSFDVMDGEGAVQDVQVNGVSVLQDGVADMPIATTWNKLGFLKVPDFRGLSLDADGSLGVKRALIKADQIGSSATMVLTPSGKARIAFYGLAEAAGDTSLGYATPDGQYTDSAKSAISTMLNGPVTVSGTTPSITALPGIQYICGEVSTLDITLPASGCVDVVFVSGSNPTVLTVTPPTGVTEVEWADGFDPDNLSANATYWLKVIDGKLGVATAWGVQSSGGGEEPWNHAHFEVTDASEQTTAFIIPNNEAVSEILVRGKALFDSYDGIYFSIDNVVLLGPNNALSSTNCNFQLYGKRIAADMWIGRGDVGQWGIVPPLLNALAKAASDNSASDGIGDIKIASRWGNKIYQVGTDIDVYWR